MEIKIGWSKIVFTRDHETFFLDISAQGKVLGAPFNLWSVAREIRAPKIFPEYR